MKPRHPTPGHLSCPYPSSMMVSCAVPVKTQRRCRRTWASSPARPLHVAIDEMVQLIPLLFCRRESTDTCNNISRRSVIRKRNLVGATPTPCLPVLYHCSVSLGCAVPSQDRANKGLPFLCFPSGPVGRRKSGLGALPSSTDQSRAAFRVLRKTWPRENMPCGR